MALSARRAKGKNVADQEWYHGFRPRCDIGRVLTYPGEFVVRARNGHPDTEIVITAVDDTNNKRNIPLKFDKDDSKWFLTRSCKFSSVVDLVEHYRANAPGPHVKLSKMIPRPEWMLQHSQIVYEEKDKLGSGRFYSIYKGKFFKNKGAEPCPVAIKVSQAGADDEAKDALMHEAQIMSYYTHDNVAQFIGAACDTSPMMLVVSFYIGGSLLDHLLKLGERTDIREKLIYLYEMSRGLFYLHNKKCVHGAIMAGNCLISSTGRIKIANFGLAKLIDDEEPDRVVRFPAPETLPSSRADIWAFGVLTCEVLRNGAMELHDKMTGQYAVPKMPCENPNKIAHLVERMWALDPVKRPKIREIAAELNKLIKESNTLLGHLPCEKLTLNLIPGVTRAVFFEHEDTSEYEDDIGETQLEVEGDKKRTPTLTPSCE